MYNSHEKGATLIFVLLILSILSVLATTLLSTTIINFRMQTLNSKSRRNFYLAESGLDEAYGIMGKLIEEAIVKGNKEAKNFINNLDLKKEKQIFFDNYFMSNQENEEESLEDVSNSFEKYILSLKQAVFQEAYKNHIEINLKNRIEKHKMLIEDEKQQPLRIVSSPLKFSKVESNNISNEKKEMLFVEIQSTYVEDKIEKIMKGHFIIEVPEYGASNSDYILKEVRKISVNPVWSHCIMAGGELNMIQENIKIDIDPYMENVILSEYIDFSKIKNRFIHHHKDFILLNNSNQDFAIMGKNSGLSEIPRNTEQIHLNHPAAGIIIVSGNLYLCGEIDFTGTIIAEGDINILAVDNQTPLKIKYDEKLIATSLDKYDIYFKDIFRKNHKEIFIEIERESRIAEEIIPFGHLQDKYIRLQDWKIVR